MRFLFVNKNKIDNLPASSGVYAFKNDGELLYIGKAANIKERVKNHFNQPTYRDNFFIKNINKIGCIKTDSEIEALVLEANLIKKYQPKFNVVWKDDKKYFYVEILKGDYPQIFITHRPEGTSDFAGPFVDGKALKEALKYLRKIFPYRSCRNIPNRACLWFHLSRCPAPCIQDSQDPKIKKILTKEAQRNARNLMALLKGKKSAVLKELKKEMKESSKKEDFEKARKLRDRIFALERVLSHAIIFENSQNQNWQKTQMILEQIINLKKYISRIEAYDISNIQGKEATGSMVAFIAGLPDKNLYRRFKIKNTNKPNDTAMLKEILERRLGHKEWPYPDLILIDGGKPQINAAIGLKSKISGLKPIKIIAIAKQKNELYIEGKVKPLLLKALSREISNLILQLRDEAHRFAIAYHKKLRETKLVGRTQNKKLDR